MTQTLVNLSINSYSNFHTVISALMLFSEKHKLAIASSVLSMTGNNRLHNLAYNNHRDKQNSGRCKFYTHTHTHTHTHIHDLLNFGFLWKDQAAVQNLPVVSCHREYQSVATHLLLLLLPSHVWGIQEVLSVQKEKCWHKFEVNNIFKI